MMSDVSEYIYWVTEPNVDPCDYVSPGFTLAENSLVEMPDWFPEDQMLIVR